MFRAVAMCCEIWETNSGPLSDWKEEGIPNSGRISVRRSEATVVARLLVVGKASTHPENVSTKTRRNLNFLTGGMWVKSSCQSLPGICPLAWWVGKGPGFKGVFWFALWQIVQLEVRS